MTTSKFNLKTKRGQAAAFRNAAKVLDQYGWRRGSMGTMTVGFCAMGALNHLLGTEFNGSYSDLFHQDIPKNSVILKCGGKYNKWNSREDTIIDFNDSQPGGMRTDEAKLRNKKTVQRFFRRIAAELEHGGVL